MAEEVIIKIALEKGDNEKAVDSFTKKITDLTKANNELKKSNNELIKSGEENSKEFIENTRQMEINKQKIQEATSSRKNLITTIIAEDDSIKGLKARNAELIKQRDQLSTSTADGQAKIAAINKELDKNNATIKDNSSALEKQKINIGNYKSALDGLVPGLGGMVDGIQSATKAGLAFIATPLGAILGALGLAIAAVTAYFKGSEEGQNKFNKLAAVGSAILEQFTNVLEDLGELLVSAFENPGQALEDFGNAILKNIVNRFIGLLELIPNISKAVGLLFEGKFAEAGEVAFDAVAKVVTGVEGATQKIAGLIDEVTKMVDVGIAAGERIAELTAKIDKDERALIEDRAKTALEVGKLRQKSIEEEGAARKKTLQEAIALEEQLAARETDLAKTRLALAELELKTNGDTKEAKKAVAEAQAAVFTAEASAFQATIKFRKEIEKLDEEEKKRLDKKLEDQIKHQAEITKLNDESEKGELERFERLRAAEQAIEQTKIEQKILEAEDLQARTDAEIELEQFKLQAFLDSNVLYQAEKEAATAKSEAAINAILKKSADEQQKIDKKTADLKATLQKQELQGAIMVAAASVRLIEEIFGRSKASAIAQAVINTAQGVTNALATSGPPWVGIAMSILVGALGAVQIAKIASTELAKGGILMAKYALGGIAQTGGILRGPSHAQGGIPFSVGGRLGFEAEGNEAIINARSTAMFRNELSAINQAGGGVAFGHGGVTRFQGGSVVTSTQTRSAAQSAETIQRTRDLMTSFFENMPPTIVTVEDINAKTLEVSEQTNRAIVV